MRRDRVPPSSMPAPCSSHHCHPRPDDPPPGCSCHHCQVCKRFAWICLAHVAPVHLDFHLDVNNSPKKQWRRWVVRWDCALAIARRFRVVGSISLAGCTETPRPSTGAGLVTLLAACPKVTVLDLKGCRDLDDFLLTGIERATTCHLRIVNGDKCRSRPEGRRSTKSQAPSSGGLCLAQHALAHLRL